MIEKIRWSVLDPFWVVAEVVIVPLVAEVHVLVTPERSLKLRFQDDISDVLLLATELFRLVHRKHLVNGHVLRD